MPTVSSPFNTQADDQENHQQNQQQNANQTTNSGPVQIASGAGASGVSSAGASAGTNPGTTAGTSSGSFTNLSKYINANKDFAADKGGLGGEIVSGINNKASQANSAINNAFNDFSNQATQNIAGAVANQDAAKQALGDPYSYLYGRSFDPSNPATAANQTNVDNLNKALNATYTGPKSFNDLSGADNASALQGQVNNVQNLAKDTNTESGRYQLLNTMFNKPSYTQGQQNLDNLILEGNPSQVAALKSTQAAAGKLNNVFNQEQNKAQSLAANSAQTANNIAQNSFQTLAGLGTDGSVISNPDNNSLYGINSAINKTLSTDKDTYNSLLNGVNNGTLVAQDYGAFGISPNTTPYLLTQDPKTMLQSAMTPTSQLTANTVATPAQAAAYNALSQLINGSRYADAITSLPTKYDQSVAGTYTGPADQQKFAQELATNQSSYNADAQAVLDQYNAARGNGFGYASSNIMPQSYSNLQDFEKSIENGTVGGQGVWSDSNLAALAGMGSGGAPILMQPNGISYNIPAGTPTMDPSSPLSGDAQSVQGYSNKASAFTVMNAINDLINKYGLAAPIGSAPYKPTWSYTPNGNPIGTDVGPSQPTATGGMRRPV